MSGAGSAGSGLGRHALTTVNGDFDELLRRALRAEADSIEPAAGGLERIRHRISAPWLVRQMSLMLTDCVDLVRLIGIRLEPGLTSAWGAVAAGAGSWRAACARLGPRVPILASLWALIGPSRRHSATHRGSPQRGNLAWLRPALAVAAAVVIVVAGVYGLFQARANLVLDLFPGSNAPASPGSGGGSGGHQGLTPQGQSAGGIVQPSNAGSSSATPSPSPSCTSSPRQAATPTPTASASGTPTGSPSTSPSPAPSDSTDPTPTGTATSTAPASGTASSQTPASSQTSASSSDPATSCGQSSDDKTASPSPTG